MMRILMIAVLLAWLAALPAQADPLRDLVLAAQLDDASGIDKLLRRGVSPNAIDPVTGESVLLLALREGSQRAIDRLLAAPDLQTELAAPNGNTALMMAAFKRNRRAVETLLARGAQVNRAGWSPLHYAAAAGDADIARLLLEHGARIDALAPGDLTPLMLAAREGQDEAVTTLLRAGADVSLRSGEGLNAAQIAVRADKRRIATLIEGARK
ncbi:MAG: ankyrin repeat domain-containing protein [Gammaproteobacteria bacterium]